MKYIRTKDKIYEIAKDISYGEKEIYKIRNHDFSIIGNGLQKADTIEELCDEFVLYDNQFKTCGVFDKKVITFKWLQNHLEIYKGMTIYGAIWTDKGLIYVAKMNEEGVLCLI